MLVKDFTLTGTRNEFTITVPTIYKFMTVFNHSRRRLQFFPDTNIDLRQMLYRVPSQIYLTLPLTLSGEVETCQRLTTYTMVSEGENIAPTNISIMFSEQMENINLPFPDPAEQPQIPDRNVLFADITQPKIYPVINKYPHKDVIFRWNIPLSASQQVSSLANNSSPYTRITGFLRASHSGVFTIEESEDNITYVNTLTHTLVANTVFSFEYLLKGVLFNIRFVNDATAQTSFNLCVVGIGV